MRNVYGWVMVALVCHAGLCFAQERQPAREPATAARAAAAPTSDQQLAAVLYACTKNHIEIAKFAQSRAQSNEVKEFAARMVKDHDPGLKKLQSAAGNLVSADGGGARIGVEAPRGVGAPPARVDVTVRAPGAGGALDWVRIQREIADQCLATTKQEFEKKDSQEFDACYMGYEVMVHMKTLDELKVLRQYASAELRKDLDAATETASGHLKEAKKLLEQFSDDSPRTAKKEKKE